MQLKSAEFTHNGLIPSELTCDGGNRTPTLMIENIPEGAKSLALIMDDPDAPRRTFVHWLMCNIPVNARIEESGMPGVAGRNDFGKEEYGGPCPPSGRHRYSFRVYALSGVLNLKKGFDKSALEKAMDGHVLATAELVGLYQRAER